VRGEQARTERCTRPLTAIEHATANRTCVGSGVVGLPPSPCFATGAWIRNRRGERQIDQRARCGNQHDTGIGQAGRRRGDRRQVSARRHPQWLCGCLTSPNAGRLLDRSEVRRRPGRAVSNGSGGKPQLTRLQRCRASWLDATSSNGRHVRTNDALKRVTCVSAHLPTSNYRGIWRSAERETFVAKHTVSTGSAIPATCSPISQPSERCSGRRPRHCKRLWATTWHVWRTITICRAFIEEAERVMLKMGTVRRTEAGSYCEEAAHSRHVALPIGSCLAGQECGRKLKEVVLIRHGVSLVIARAVHRGSPCFQIRCNTRRSGAAHHSVQSRLPIAATRSPCSDARERGPASRVQSPDVVDRLRRPSCWCAWSAIGPIAEAMNKGSEVERQIRVADCGIVATKSDTRTRADALRFAPVRTDEWPVGRRMPVALSSGPLRRRSRS
jgi:hypothetical protein